MKPLIRFVYWATFPGSILGPIGSVGWTVFYLGFTLYYGWTGVIVLALVQLWTMQVMNRLGRELAVWP